MKPPLVVNTSILIDHLRGFEPATRFIADALSAPRPVLSSELCRLEVLAGMRRREVRGTETLLALLEWWPVDGPVLDRAGALARSNAPANRGIGAVDYVVAATTEIIDGELATTNVKHFPMVRGLLAPY